MKIAVLSDTHGNYDWVLDYLLLQPTDYLIHLGDLVRDAEDLADFTSIPTIKVKGNNDYYERDTPEYHLVELAGKRFFLTHGHKFQVYHSLDFIFQKGKGMEADFVLFGHTHRYQDEMVEDLRILNPGSPSRPRGGGAGFLIIQIRQSTGEVAVERILK